MKLPVNHKILPAIIALSLLLSVAVSPALAVETLLTHIGPVGTNNVRYNQWWVTQTNPTLSGRVNPNAAVLITLDGSVMTTNADVEGNWSYATTLAAGDHAVVVESDQDQYPFTLTVGSAPDGLASGSAETKGGELPVAGMALPTLVTGLLGAGAIGGGWWKMKK